jgi:hypothetical protein
MRSVFTIWPLALVTACTQTRAVVRGLYEAIVHNSGAPSQEERTRIDERQLAFLRNLPQRRLVVAPVAILAAKPRYDSSAAMSIADSLRGAGLGTPKVAEHAVVVPFVPQTNEAMIFWSRFKALADTVRAHPPADADYVLLVDVIGVAPERRGLGAVHAMVVTSTGEMAYSGMWNSAQPLYKELRPRTVDDAARMVTTDITRKAHDTR